jgi:hypothetical protein
MVLPLGVGNLQKGERYAIFNLLESMLTSLQICEYGLYLCIGYPENSTSVHSHQL